MTDIEALKEALIHELEGAEKEIEFTQMIGGITNKIVNDSYKILRKFSKKQLIALVISYRMDKVLDIIDKMENTRKGLKDND